MVKSLSFPVLFMRIMSTRCSLLVGVSSVLLKALTKGEGGGEPPSSVTAFLSEIRGGDREGRVRERVI